MVRIDAAVYFSEEDRHRSLFRSLNIDSKVDQELTYPRSVGDSILAIAIALGHVLR